LKQNTKLSREQKYYSTTKATEKRNVWLFLSTSVQTVQDISYYSSKL